MSRVRPFKRRGKRPSPPYSFANKKFSFEFSSPEKILWDDEERTEKTEENLVSD